MKALTLWQPWATLIAIGAKEYETRHWKTDYRGPLVIHAAKRKPRPLWLGEPLFASALAQAGYETAEMLPLGAGLCVVELLDVVATDDVEGSVSDQEWAFGDFTIGRFAWELKMIEVFPEPIPARGDRKLWSWPQPVHIGEGKSSDDRSSV